MGWINNRMIRMEKDGDGKNLDGWMIRMGSFGTDDKDRAGTK